MTSSHFLGCYAQKVGKVGFADLEILSPSILSKVDLFYDDDGDQTIIEFFKSVFESSGNSKFRVFSNSASLNNYVIDIRGERPLTKDYLTIMKAITFVRAMESNVANSGASLLALLQDTWHDGSKGSYTFDSFFSNSFSALLSTFNDLALELNQGALRLNDSKLALIKNKIDVVTSDYADLKDPTSVTRIPLAIAILVDLANFLKDIDVLFDGTYLKSVTTKVLLTEVPAVANFQVGGKDFIEKFLVHSTVVATAKGAGIPIELLLEKAPFAVKERLSGQEKAESSESSKVYAARLTSAWLWNEYNARWDTYFSAAYSLRTKQILLDKRWKYLKEYVGLHVIKSAITGSAFPNDVTILLPFFNDLKKDDQSAESINGVKCPATDEELSNQLSVRTKKVEPILPLVLDAIDFAYYKTDTPFKGFRTYRSYHKDAGRNLIVRAEDVGHPKLHQAGEFSDETVNAFSVLGNTVDSTATFRHGQKILPSNVVNLRVPFEQNTFTTNMTAAEIEGFRKLIEYYTTYVETTFDSVTRRFNAWKEQHAFIIYPPKSGPDNLAFWDGARLDAMGEFYRCESVDIAGLSLPKLLSVFRYEGSSLPSDSEYLKRLFESRIASLGELKEPVAGAVFMRPARVLRLSPLAQLAGVIRSVESVDETLIVGPSTNKFREVSLSRDYSFKKESEDLVTMVVPLAHIQPQIIRIFERNNLTEYSVGVDTTGSYSVKINKIAPVNGVDCMALSFKGNAKDSASFGGRKIRRMRADGSYVVDLLYPESIRHEVASRHVNFQNADGVFGNDYKRFLRIYDLGVYASASSGGDVYFTILNYLAEICKAFVFDASKLSTVPFFNDTIAYNELSALKGLQYPKGLLAANFGYADGNGSITDVFNLCAEAVKAYESKDKDTWVEAFRKLSQMLIPRYIENLLSLHVVCPPIIDSYCDGIMKLIIEDDLEWLEPPIAMEGLTGPLEASIAEVVLPDIQPLVTNVVLKAWQAKGIESSTGRTSPTSPFKGPDDGTTPNGKVSDLVAEVAKDVEFVASCDLFYSCSTTEKRKQAYDEISKKYTEERFADRIELLKADITVKFSEEDIYSSDDTIVVKALKKAVFDSSKPQDLKEFQTHYDEAIKDLSKNDKKVRSRKVSSVKDNSNPENPVAAGGSHLNDSAAEGSSDPAVQPGPTGAPEDPKDGSAGDETPPTNSVEPHNPAGAEL